MTTPPVTRATRFHTALAWMAGTYLVATAGMLLVNGAAARLVGPDGFAAFVVVLTATTLAAQVGLAGLEGLAVRDSVSLRGGVEPAELADHTAYIRTASRVLLPLAGLGCAAVLPVLLAPGPGVDLLLVAPLVLALTWFGGQQKLFAKYLRGLGDVRTSSLLEGRSGGALTLASQGVVLLVVLVWHGPSSVAVALLAVAVAAAPASALGRRACTRRLGRPRSPWHPLRDLRLTMRRSSGFSGLQVGMFLDTLVDLFVATALLGAVAASSFAASHRLAILLVVPTGLVATVIAPMLVRRRDSRPQLDELCRAGSTIAFVTSAAVAVPLLVLPDVTSSALFGPSLPVDTLVLRLLALGALVRAASNLGSLVLSMTGHEQVANTLRWAGVLLRVAVCGLAGVAWGAVGIAVASLASTVAVQGWIAVECWRRSGAVPLPSPRPRLRTLLRSET